MQDQELSAELRMARAALHRLDTIGSETRSSPEVVERVRGFYADRIERLERRREMHESSDAEQAEHATLHVATRELLGRLLEIEQAELQGLRNSAVVDSLVARRLQVRLDVLRLHDGK